MTKETMIRNYRKFSAADGYILGFIYKKMLYAIEVPEIMPRYIRLEHTSSKTGHKKKLQFRLTNKYMEQLIRKGAVCLGGQEMVISDEWNKGVVFERLIYSLNSQEPRGKDSVGFWESGDINIDGRELQVKFNGAQIVIEDTLERLKKGIQRGSKGCKKEPTLAEMVMAWL